MNVQKKIESRKTDRHRIRLSETLSQKEDHCVFIGIGSNIDPVSNLPKAIAMLRKYVVVEAVSSAWETPAQGSRGPNFLNSAVRIRTKLSAPLLKTIILRRIEVQLGRIRSWNKNAPRTIDLDILVFDDHLLDPKVWTQPFIAIPLAELIPDYKNETTHETLKDAAERMAKEMTVKPCPDVNIGDNHDA